MSKSIFKLSRGYLRREPRFILRRVQPENVNGLERGLSLLFGAGLVALGMRRRWRSRMGLTAAASALIRRGLTGRSRVYEALHVTSA
jgi:uncharacterized membrane protein